MNTYTHQPLEELLRRITAETEMTSEQTGRPSLSPRVMAAMRRVPRERFVAPADRELAWIDSALGIGYGQTISQPFIVALMTDLLELSPGDRVLEIGTGSGYQAAVLAELGAEVYTVERIGELAASARARLVDLGYDIAVRHGDGRLGWPEHAPYVGIVVTAASETVPPALREQLAPGGRLVIPLGNALGTQTLVRITADEHGKFHPELVLEVIFVPLLSGTTGDEPDLRRVS